MEEEKDIFEFIEKRSIDTPDESYFQGLADNVIAKSKVPSLQKAKIVPLYKRPITWISGIAAAILVAFLLLPNEPSTIVDPARNANFSDLSRQEVLAYVNENIEDFDEELLVEFIALKQLKTETTTVVETEPEESLETLVKTETKDLQESLKSISDDEILEYLEEEGLDSDDLEEDLFL